MEHELEKTSSCEILNSEIEKAFLQVGILTFTYFPQEKIMEASNSFADFFKCPHHFENMPQSLADALIHPDDHIALSQLAEEIDKGTVNVCANLRTQSGYLSRVTIVASEFDENNKIKKTIGIVQPLNDQVRAGKAVESLSSDYASVYFIDLEKDKIFPQRLSNDIEKEFGAVFRNNPPYEVAVKSYIEHCVVESEKKEMLSLTSIENLKKLFKDKDVFIHDYRIERNGELRICRMKAVDLSDGDELKYISMGFSDMTMLKTAELEQYAFVDPVTGGNNYLSFKKKVKNVNKPGAFISLDIRNFKIVNTVCGVERGDQTIQYIWKVCNNFCEGEAVCGHVNADHFVMYFPGISEKTVIRITEMITYALLELSTELEIPKLIPYFGVTQWSEKKDIESAFSETTVAKHSAKTLKDLNYVFYSDEETKKILFEKSLEDKFNSDLNKGRFKVWYQPKYNPVTNKMTGAEALVRWQNEDNTFLPPIKFIPLFESDGLIKTLDEYVFTTVCKMQKQRELNGEKLIPISINLSRASIYFGDIVRRYKKISQNIGISPKYVPIEITETAAVANEDVLHTMERFHQEGFPIFIDDFGTGYSSLSTLNSFHFDNLKIDKSLIDYIGDYRGDKLLEHTIGLSKDLGMQITAEGVESIEQIEFLKNLGCDNIQGYYYSKPLPFEEFQKLYK